MFILMRVVFERITNCDVIGSKNNVLMTGFLYKYCGIIALNVIAWLIN
jgi:hypothetical protein